MPNNRDKSQVEPRASNPRPDEISGLRTDAGLTQQQAADLIRASKRSWENWEQGRVKMHPGLFDYFLIRIGQKQSNSIPQK